MFECGFVRFLNRLGMVFLSCLAVDKMIVWVKSGRFLDDIHQHMI